MRIGQMKNHIVQHYFGKRREDRRYGLLYLGPPGVGKSMVVEEAGEDIAKRLNKEFIKVVVRWSAKLRKFTIANTGEHEIDHVLAEADKFFVFTDFRLSTVEPSDLSGIPRSRDGITFYDPLLWAVLHSASEGILFLDELTWIQREDVWSVTPQLVLDKLAGLTAFHPKTLVIAAGNRPEDASSIVRLIHNPLLNRFKILKISPSSEDDWAAFMNEKYGDEWNKKTYSFLKRFADEGYLLQVPKTPEGLENFPTPRSWSWLALDLYEGVNNPEDMRGLVGEEIGIKFEAFMKLNVDIEDLIRVPNGFHSLDFDAKYMVPIMLANWLTHHDKTRNTAFPLLDEMGINEKHEFLVMTCICMSKKNLISLLKELFVYKPVYNTLLSEIAVGIKDEIEVR